MTFEAQVNSAFVKKAPTTRKIMVVQNTAEKLHIKIITRNKEVPYCDCFENEEDW